MKESYRREQKRRIKELSSALKDPSVIILSSWLKVSSPFINEIVYYKKFKEIMQMLMSGQIKFYYY